MMRGLLCLGALLWTSIASADFVTLDINLDALDAGKLRLTGQSAYRQTLTDSITSGGQLDGVESGFTTKTYEELFPPASLADYLGFAYLGIIETLDDEDNVIDTSLVVAFVAGAGVGQSISDTFPYTESELVTAFTTSFDSPEFMSMSGLVSSTAATLGDIAVPPIGKPGTTLNLIAFIGGDDGDLGVQVGTLTTTVVPEPSTLGLLLIGGGALVVCCRRFRK